MEYAALTSTKDYTLRLYRGEPVHETISSFCEKEGITHAWCSAIGAIESIELGYYSLEERSYYWKEYSEAHEVVTMTGNVSLVDDAPFLHIHTTISDDENRTYGGHLKSAIVAVTLEVQLCAYDARIERAVDDVTGLKLMNCPHVHI
jgi:uncharacterized protein